jgi:predicted unusual protein kinase regulating ubiquinone biosynthesis (AarF/ABC1/UbiB family)
VKELFTYLFKYLDGLDTKGLKEAVESNEVQAINSLKINRDFVSLIRVFSLLDGTITRLDPNYSYINALQPYTSSIWTDRIFLETMAKKDISKLGNTFIQYPANVEKTDASMMRVQNKVTTLKQDIKNMQTTQYVQACMSILTLLIMANITIK